MFTNENYEEKYKTKVFAVRTKGFDEICLTGRRRNFNYVEHPDHLIRLSNSPPPP